MKKDIAVRVSKRLAIAGALGALALAQLPALAEEHHEGHHKEQAKERPGSVGQALTPRLRQLLSEEMLSIQQASAQLLTGIISGEHALVENMARQIHDSFILEKSLTEKDKKDLLKAVPPEFLRMDGAFHGTALKLSEAAARKDRELEVFYYSRLVEGCQSCHASFATDRFPGFSGKQAEAHAH